MDSTVAFGEVFSVAQITDSIFGRMGASVLWLVSQFQILYSIVISYAILMMNYLSRQKKPANILLHNQAVFSYVAYVVFIRMIWSMNKIIPFSIKRTNFPAGESLPFPALKMGRFSILLPDFWCSYITHSFIMPNFLGFRKRGGTYV